MSDFYLWFSLGMEHIADWKGYDHILFLLALCGVYNLGEWKKLIILITAFTIGHSVTLAISTFDVFTIKGPLIEFLIPVSILLTCFYNLFNLERKEKKNYRMNFFMALSFGFVHGMGFSYLLKSLLGKEESILYPLLAFNLGLEAGQIIIVGGVMFFSLLLTFFIGVKQRDRNLFVSAAVFGIAFIMASERLIELIN